MQIRMVLVVVAVALTACGGKQKGSAEASANSNRDMMPKVDPSLCETSGKRVETYDLNQDGQPDVWKMFAAIEEDGAKLDVLTCKQVDYDHDGKKDYVATFNRQGAMTAEQFDFTFDGNFDSTEHYDKKSGDIYMVERDLDHNKSPDTWEKYNTSGQLESIERDRNGDGRADLWEQYQAGSLIAILYDDDYDRKVDRKESSRPLPSTTPTAPGPGNTTAPGEPVDTVEGDVRKPDIKEESPLAPGAKPGAGSKPATQAPAGGKTAPAPTPAPKTK